MWIKKRSTLVYCQDSGGHGRCLAQIAMQISLPYAAFHKNEAHCRGPQFLLG